MRVALVTGSYPPDICGVGDYVSRLHQELLDVGCDVEIILHDRWRLRDLAEILGKISSVQPDIVHIQYPTIGYGYSLSPQVLGFAKWPCVVTLHEFSQAHILRRLSIFPFTLAARKLVFTTDFELECVSGRMPWVASRSCTIPIGSPFSSNGPLPRKDNQRITYFGLIRPNKGLEEVLVVARLIKAQRLPHSIQIIGAIAPRFGQYYEQLRAKASELPIEWAVDSSDAEVGQFLARTQVAYAPFPDGASERRSSLLALLQYGIATVSTAGAFTTKAMRDAIRVSQNPEDALPMLEELLTDSDRREDMRRRAIAYGQRHDWRDIAERHYGMYRDAIAGRFA